MPEQADRRQGDEHADDAGDQPRRRAAAQGLPPPPRWAIADRADGGEAHLAQRDLAGVARRAAPATGR